MHSSPDTVPAVSATGKATGHKSTDKPSDSATLDTTGRIYIAIDLKSFYASVECVDRGRDPLTTHLVVADTSRTQKTICLAVSPSLKAYGIAGRARLFEVIQRVKELNAQRQLQAPGGRFRGHSDDALLLAEDASMGIGFIAATPRMARYMEISDRIYRIYLKYVAAEDIHVYSIDEVFIDVTDYLTYHNATPRELCMRIIRDVLHITGITATAGIGTNLYLAKVAMDIVAKHEPADKDGVRIAELDEMTYRKTLWTHTPLTDFWRVGVGTANRLHRQGLYTMGDIARCSLGSPYRYHNAALLYKVFGINAELLIDHAWGYESATIPQIRSYVPRNSSLSEGQVLMSPYPFAKGRLIVQEMADQLALNLVSKGLLTNHITLHIGYDADSLKNPDIARSYTGKTGTDYYGRQVPASAHGSRKTACLTSAASLITEAALSVYDSVVNPMLPVRRVNISCSTVTEQEAARRQATAAPVYEQLDLFADPAVKEAEAALARQQEEKLARERKLQDAVLTLKDKFGKNAVLKGMNFEEGGTTRARNNQIGGHRA